MGFVAAAAVTWAGPISFISFDVTGLYTVGGISNNGNLVGAYNESNPVGFERFANGTIQTGILYPSTNGTVPEGINSAGLIGGVALITGAEFPFTLSGGIYSISPSFGSGTSIGVGGVNDAGDLAGTVDTQGFLALSGQSPTEFTIPGAFDLMAFGVNDEDQVVGSYRDASGTHGFIRNPDGSIVTIDFPGATSTFLTGINDAGVVAGTCLCGGLDEGIYGTPGNLTSFTIGSVATVVGGINDAGQISGSYID
jgi:hypothetical protein